MTPETAPDRHLNLDLDRARRCGCPEVVYGAGKTVAEILCAGERLLAEHGQLLVTRASDAALDALAAAHPSAIVSRRGRCCLIDPPEPVYGPVGVVSGGTSDAPVVEELLATLRLRAVRVVEALDCGVAGLHRLLGRLPDLAGCRVLIAVAGMEAALPTVLCGLVSVPVIGVPTSVGYGVAAGGQAALHSLLASCAAGLVVVNIDNGFGAGFAAASMVRQMPVGESDSVDRR